MVIHSSGLFAHRAILRRDPAGIWRGRVEPNRREDGLVGDAPDLELSGGTLTLARTQASGDDRRSRVSIPLGPAFECVLRDGDVLHAMRAGTGDLAATLSRNDELVMAIGAVDRQLGRAPITVETDPRVREQAFPALAATIARADTRLVWLDPEDPDLEAQIDRISAPPRGIDMVLIVVRSDDSGKVTELNRRVMTDGRGRVGRWFESVSERFQTQADWLEYINGLPSPWPPDPFLRFVTDGRSCELREGEYRCHEPWHLYVHKVYKRGIPGELSQLGVARADPALSVESFVSSVEQVASGVVHGLFG